MRTVTLRYNKEIILQTEPADKTGNAPGVSHGLAAVFLPADTEIHVGDEIALFSRIRVIQGDKKPISSFDCGKIRSGIRIISRAGREEFALIRSHGPTLREKIRGEMDSIIHRVFSSQTAAIVQALYFGESTRIDKLTVFNFKRAGVLHILAASGFNVGIVAAVPFFLFAPLRVNRKLILAFSIMVVSFYLYITGMPVSLLRAAIMFLVYALQRLLDLDRNPMNSLFISAIIILVLFPYELYSAGFQLTYGATAGIILLFRGYRSSIPGIPPFIGSSLALTLSAQALVFPIILLHMEEVNLTGIISNLVLIPGTSAVFLMSMAACCLYPILPWCAQYTGAATSLVCSINLSAVRLLAESGGHFQVGGTFMALLIPYLLYLVPVIPTGDFFQRRGYVFLAAAFLSSYLVLSFRVPVPSPVAVLSSSASAIITGTHARETIIYGKLGNLEDTEKLLAYVSTGAANRLVLCIPAPDYASLHWFSIIAKRANISRCIISPVFRLNSAMSSLCSILDADRVPLEIADLPALKMENLRSTLSAQRWLDTYLVIAGTADNPPKKPVPGPQRSTPAGLPKIRAAPDRTIIRLE